MKNIMLFFAVLLLAACNSKPSTTETVTDSAAKSTDTTMAAPASATEVENKEADGLYACPMHPEVQGRKNDECSKCGMKLTEPVKS